MFIEIVSPEKTIFTGDVSSVYLPGSEGFFQILDNHAPIVSTLKKGTIELSGEFNTELSQNLSLSVLPQIPKALGVCLFFVISQSKPQHQN